MDIINFPLNRYASSGTSQKLLTQSITNFLEYMFVLEQNDHSKEFKVSCLKEKIKLSCHETSFINAYERYYCGACRNHSAHFYHKTESGKFKSTSVYLSKNESFITIHDDDWSVVLLETMSVSTHKPSGGVHVLVNTKHDILRIIKDWIGYHNDFYNDDDDDQHLFFVTMLAKYASVLRF